MTNKRWIQSSVEHKGRVRKYIKRVYGNKGFNQNGDIKPEYLNRAETRARHSKNVSLERAIILAKRLKKMPKR